MRGVQWLSGFKHAVPRGCSTVVELYMLLYIHAKALCKRRALLQPYWAINAAPTHHADRWPLEGI
jgi:hypothetical protein